MINRNNMRKIYSLIIASLFLFTVQAQTGNKILFDARKAEMAGNADWVIDADLFNIGTGTGGVMQTGKGSEANPQRYPTPAQSGVISSTGETYWKGALSAWAIAMVKRGYAVETLPYNGSITYGNSSNTQDLSNYKIYVCVEPNIRFTAAEKTAILQFVQNGGGLFMVADHTASDRNNDGWDSPAIWNDLMSNNGTVSNPFGITFNLVTFSQTTSAVANLATNSILHGAAGNVTQMKFSSGTSMTLNKTANPNALGLVFKTGSSTTGSTNVMFAQSKYGSGRIAAIGDSSPIDDGTGDTGDQLYNGWSAEVSGNHSRIITNATLWLAGAAPRLEDEAPATSLQIWPNPANETAHIGFISTPNQESLIQLIDLTGRVVYSTTVQNPEEYTQADITLEPFAGGIYFISVTSNGRVESKRVIKP